MPNPQDVNTTAYTVSSVLFNHNDFSVALGTWNDSGNLAMAMRWNYANDGNGYPKVFAHPQWFLISDDIARNLLHGLLSNPLLTPQEYKLILDALTRI